LNTEATDLSQAQSTVWHKPDYDESSTCCPKLIVGDGYTEVAEYNYLPLIYSIRTFNFNHLTKPDVPSVSGLLAVIKSKAKEKRHMVSIPFFIV
jgi:hypothetical protein